MKILLIDDHPLILAALQVVIQGLAGEVRVSGASGARTAREMLARDAGYDLVLLDLSLGDADGFELLVELRAAYPALPVVVVSASDRASDVIRAIDLGAMGFVPKRASNDTLCDALRVVMSGGLYVPPMTLDAAAPSRVAEAAPQRAPLAAPPTTGLPGRAEIAALGLTPRQTDVLALLLRGQPNKLIARELKLSVETVKDHVAAVLRTLGVSSRTQAVLAISQMGHGGISAWRHNALR